MRRRALLIVNAKSRSGRAAAKTSVEGLNRIGIDPVYRDCTTPDDLSPLIAEQASDVDLIIIARG